MSETKWTPGPWRVMTHYSRERLVNEYSGNTFSCIMPPEQSGSWPEDTICEVWSENQPEEANANLIAAAPELYEALYALLIESEDIFVCMADATGIDRHNLPEQFARARAALAKAHGET